MKTIIFVSQHVEHVINIKNGIVYFIAHPSNVLNIKSQNPLKI